MTLISVLEQLVSDLEQLQKYSGAVTKVFQSSKCSRAVNKSSGTLISLPEQLISAMEQLRKCSGAVTEVFRSS